MAYSRGRVVSNIWRVPILEDHSATWTDAEQLTFDEANIDFVDVTPDGDRLLIASDRSGNRDLWMLPANGGELIQVTKDLASDNYPKWSPDGQNIGFYSLRSGNREIWILPVDGGPLCANVRETGRPFEFNVEGGGVMSHEHLSQRNAV